MAFCTRCKQDRSDIDFTYRKSRSKGLRLQPCIACRKQDYVDNKSIYQKRTHDWNTSEHGRAYYRIRDRIAYAVSNGRMRQKAAERYYRNSEVICLQQAEYRRRYRQKQLARYAARNAVRNGILVEPPCCEWCGRTGPLEKHHVDHSRPLDIIWLCSTCHGTTRRKAG